MIRFSESEEAFSFESFMESALYHPDTGYYTRNIKSIGARGDFATSASLHDALAQAIARWILEVRSECLDSRLPWHVIEIGAGTGRLAAHILRCLSWWKGLGLRYHIVETSPILSSHQRGFLEKKRRPFFSAVQWHTRIEDALAQAQGRAIVFSNELVDAFPCELLEFDGEQWRQVCVTSSHGSDPVESLKELPGVLDSSPFSALRHADWRKSGQRVEIHASYRDWLKQWLPCLRSGAVLTIDYGAAVGGLYHRRPHGTLRAYFQHLVLEGLDVYRRPGRQDITADVNFADLRHWGEEAGLVTHSFQTQRDFLRHFLPETCPAQKKTPFQDTILAFLSDPCGAGEAFKVLDQRRK